MSSSPTLVIVPGWRNSGPGHWQSLWAQRVPGAVRVEMPEDDWQRPKRNVWVQAIARTIRTQPGPVVVAAHSLGCIATTHLPSDVARRVQGALLVAPADPERRGVLADFAPVPTSRCLTVAYWWPARPTRFARCARQGLMPAPGAARWCACKTLVTSTSSLATANGRWAWPFCNP